MSSSNQNNSNSHNSNQDTTSYTAMATGLVGEPDLDAIGAHCQMEYCRQLDFLPFRCESCKGTFCQEHRTESGHKCVKAGEWARRRAQANGAVLDGSAAKPAKKTIINYESQCAELHCKTLINTAKNPAVECDSCNRLYCLKHRLKEEHDCKNLKPIGARQTSAADLAAAARTKSINALEKLRAWTASKKAETAAASAKSSVFSFGKSSASAARTAAAKELASLKATAKGDATVPADQRVYLHVEASADTTKAKHPSGKFFYGSKWTVGRLLDAAARSLQVENVNNRGGGEEAKLRVFHVEAGRVLAFGEKVGEVLASGNTIVLVRGIGDPDAVNLIDVEEKK